MVSRRVISIMILASTATVVNADNQDTGSLVNITSAEEVEWGYLNPLRGVVIEGMMHNDDPSAAKMWMPPGSFWTHTTAANGGTNLIYLEIDSGPYLVQPSDEKFDNGERPLNLHADNVVWLKKSDLHAINADNVQVTHVWGSTADMGGSMIELGAGFEGELMTDASEFRGWGSYFVHPHQYPVLSAITPIPTSLLPDHEWPGRQQADIPEEVH